MSCHGGPASESLADDPALWCSMGHEVGLPAQERLMSVIDGKLGRLQHFYRSGPLPCPYIPGRVERKLFTRLNGGDAAGAEHHPVAGRVPAQPRHRLPPGLPRLPRLRAGAHPGGALRAWPQHAPGLDRQSRPRPPLGPADRQRRAVRPVPALPAAPARRQRHGADVAGRLRQHDRGRQRQRRADRVPRPDRRPARGGAGRRAGGRVCPPSTASTTPTCRSAASAPM